ncbi:hypothetical protein KSS87_022421 [Heliosperma pusillum]|nr:hypothetical protein KSS87_022421 [Heliosperma pusillum]
MMTWIDVHTNTKQFQSLYYYLLENVALDQSCLTKLVIQAQRDLFLLLSRFMFFYNAVDHLESFLNHFPPFPTSFLVGGPADIFVTEVADQLQNLKVEPVLLHYLSQINILQGLELRMTTSTRLKSCLYSFTPPGGPMYPTRTVRHAAWDVLDALFPVSWAIPSACHKSILSTVISMVLAIFLLAFFRLLHKSHVLLLSRIDRLKLGEAQETQDVQERYVVFCNDWEKLLSLFSPIAVNFVQDSFTLEVPNICIPRER